MNSCMRYEQLFAESYTLTCMIVWIFRLYLMNMMHDIFRSTRQAHMAWKSRDIQIHYIANIMW